MKHKILSIMAISAIILFLRGNCFAQISGIITNDTTWADSVRLNGDVVIDTGATLSIHPGTRINVTTSGVWDTTLGISGKRDLIILGKAQIKGTDTDSIFINGLGTIRIKNNACDTIKYVKISNATKGLWIDSSECNIQNAVITLNKNGIYATSSKIRIDACVIQNCYDTGVGFVAGIYCVNTNVILSGSIIYDIRTEYSIPAYGFYAIGGDSVTITNTTINNIKGGSIDYALLNYAGGCATGIYRKKGLYTELSNLMVSQITGGKGASINEFYIISCGGPGGDAIGIVFDSTSVEMTDITIDSCIGGDGGDVGPGAGYDGIGGSGGDGTGIYCRNTVGQLNMYSILNIKGGNGGLVEMPGLPGCDGIGSNILLTNNSNLIINGIEGEPEYVSTHPLQTVKCIPNPFNYSTRIQYSLPKLQTVNLCIYNIAGQRIKTLANGQKSAGTYSVVWKGDNDENRRITPGVYFCRMQTSKKSSTVKVIFLK